MLNDVFRLFKIEFMILQPEISVSSFRNQDMIQFTAFFTLIIIVWVKDVKIIYANDIKRFENIIKSPVDKRSYRGLILENELKVMLISDPTADKSEASLLVEIGAMYDIKGIPGSVNLLGYALMKENKKYSEVNEFQNFLTAHGGNKGPYQSTDAHHQFFSFSIDPDYFSQGLDRFAQFFHSENLTAEAITSALLDVEKDFQFYRKHDNWRILEIEKLTSKRNHPFNHLFTGNMASFLHHFPEALRDSLVKFYDLWYSSNIMNLAVLGRESLNELEELVTSLFQTIENKNTKLMVYSDKYHPWGPDQIGWKIYIVPLKPIHILRLNFPTPKIHNNYKMANPVEMTIELLKYHGPGNLVSTLQEKKFCDSLDAKFLAMSGVGLFTISVNLTATGMSNVNFVIELIFQYINMLIMEGVQEWMFDEIKRTSEMQMYKEHYAQERGLTYVQAISIDMKIHSLDNALFPHRKRTIWNPMSIYQFLCFLTPDNMNITVASKLFEEIAKHSGEHFGINYRVEKVPENSIKKWDSIKDESEIKLPQPNKFLPKSFDLYPINEKTAPKKPYIIRKTSLLQVWFLQDTEFRVPRQHIWLEFIRPMERSLVSYRVMWLVYGLYLQLSTKRDVLYSAASASFEWDIGLTDHTMSIDISGFNDTISLLLKELISKAMIFRRIITRPILERLKKMFCDMIMELQNRNITSLASWYSALLINQYSWDKNIILIFIKKMKLQDLKRFAWKFFSRGYIKVFIHGNCSKKDALNIVSIIEKQFQSTTNLVPQEMVQSRKVQIDDRSHFIYKEPSRRRINYLYYAFFEYSTERTVFNTVVSHSLAKIIESGCKDLAHDHFLVVVCSDWNNFSGRGIAFMVESTKNPSHVDSIIENYLQMYVPKILEEMTPDEFDTHKKEFAKLYRYSSLAELSRRYWSEITDKFYNFERMNLESEILDSLTKTDLIAFFKENLHHSSPSRRKLSVYVFPVGSTVPKDTIPSEANEIVNITEFKNYSVFLPIEY